MPVTNTPIFPQAVVNTGITLFHGTGLVQFAASGTATGTMSPFFTAGANGSILTAIMISNMDTATCTAAILLSTGGAGGTFVQMLGMLAVAGGGTTTQYIAPATNFLNGTQGPQNLPFDSCGNRILYVAAGSTLNVGLLSTIITAFGGGLNVSAIGGNF